MSEVKIEWQQRAAGRWPGHIETVELTDFVESLIKQGRVEVVDETVYPDEIIAALLTES